MNSYVESISERMASEPLQEDRFAWISPAAFWPPEHVVESAWLEHGPFAFWLVDAVRPDTFVELGTHNGFSYFSFCQAVQWLRLSTACYAVDTWLGDEHAGSYGEEVFEQVAGLNDKRYSGFSRLLRCRFDEALPYFDDGSIDLLHIDGRHYLDDVRQDFETWRPKLSSRGVVLFHDINVRERDFGVWRLWAELSAQYPSFSFPHGHGLGVLAIGPEIPPGLQPLLNAGPDRTDLIRTAYARLGLAVRRQDEHERTHTHLHEAVEERDRLRHEHQAALAERDRLQDEHRAALAERDRQCSATDEQARAAAELRHSLAREAAAAHAARAHSQLIEQSTFWRASAPLRALLGQTSSSVRRMLRRGTKALWWAVTPHRLPERIAFLRARGRGELPPLQHGPELLPLPGPGLPESRPSEAVTFDHGWFDPDYYLNQEPRLERIDVDPFTHYVTIGWRQNRNPHPLFDVQWWLKHHPPGADGEIEPLQHFLSLMRSGPAAADAGVPRGWARSARDFGGIPTRVPAPYTPPGRAHLASTQDAAVLDRLESVEVFSLDIFDTALIRRVAHPTSVFDLTEAAARAIDPRFGTFADLRFWAEREARNIGQREAGTVEIGLRHIYDVLQKELKLSDGERNQLEQLELDIERKMLRANPTVLGWYRKAKAAGKKTIFVSDMYLPSAFLKEVLSAAGYEDPAVYVSNEYGVGKGQLALYEKVAADLGIPGERILHLGDNHQADKQSAEAMGWNAVHYVEHASERPYALQMADVSTLDISNAAASVGLGLAREHRVRIEASDVDAAERIARHVGYEVVGPTALAFAGWVAKRAKADRLDKILFLARDGLLTQEIYEILRESGFAVGESRYVLASRRLLYSQRMLTLDGLRDATAKLDFSQTTTLRDYLDMFLIRSDDIIAHCASRLGIGDVDAPILDQLGKRDDYGAAKRLLGEVVLDLAPTILERANAASDDLLRYYREASGIEDSKVIGLVDLGWSGSVMPSLKSLFGTLAPSATMRSYFFGLVANRKNHLPTDLPADAYFFMDGIFGSYLHTPLGMPSPRQHVDVIGACPALMEVLLSENTTTAIGLQSDPATGALSAVRSQDTLSAEQRRLIAVMHEEALRFARDAVEILGSDPSRWDFRALLAQAWNRLLSSPDSAEASLLGTFPHRADGGGGAATSTLVSSGHYHGRTALSDAGQVLWPAGWFALLDSSERALLLERLHATAKA